MNKFDLTKEPWIPCLMLDGTLKEFGLLDTLAKAREIKEISDDSPLVTVSLHRLLLAILHRNFGPQTFEDWKNLWRKGFWDAEKLKSYFESNSCKNRFNLFDDERPFYQYSQVLKAGGKEADVSPLEILMQERAAGNNATLFDHSFEDKPNSHPAATAARYLIARQAFSIGFGRSYPFYFSDSTMIRGFTYLAYGKNLFETLALNLVVYNRQGKPMPTEDDDGVCLDKPFWEQEHLLQASERDDKGTTLKGYLDYLTWQSRRIKLFPNEDYKTVSFCQIQQNYKLKAENIFDPFKTYQSNDKEGWKPKGLIPNKSLWRDSHTIFRKTNDATYQAALFKHLANVWKSVDEGEIEGKKNYRLSVFGLATEINKAASILVWAHERLPLPLVYLDNENLLADLQSALNFVEEIAKILNQSVNSLAFYLIPKPATENKGGEEKGSKKDWDKAQILARNFQATPMFWSMCEIPFQAFLSDLPENRESAIEKWFKITDESAQTAWRKTADSLNISAREQKAIVEAQSLFFNLRSRIFKSPEFSHYAPKSKSQGGNQ